MKVIYEGIGFAVWKVGALIGIPMRSGSWSVKDDRLYEKLREDAASKEKAARIANAKTGGESVSEKGGEAENYEDRTKEELKDRVAELGIEGRSEMR